MKRMIGGIILILFVLPGFVSAISQGSTVGIIMGLLFIAGGGTMAYYGIKRIRRTDLINKIDTPPATAAQKTNTPPEPPPCKDPQETVATPPVLPPARSKVVAGLLALFLGSLGVHRFYLGQWWGLFYLFFCWTYIPGIVAVIEAIVFFCTSDEAWKKKHGGNSKIKNRKRERCCGCGNYLTFSNRHWGNYGLLKDEGEICGSCTRKMESIVGVFKFKPKNFTKAEIVDRIGIPGVQPATDTVIDKTDTAEPVRAEKCCVCGSDLKFLTRNFGNNGILKDGGEICINCTSKMRSIAGIFKYKPWNFTTAEVTDRIRELDKEREEKARQKQEQRIAKQKEREAAELVRQESKIEQLCQKNIETWKVQDQIQNAKSYSVEYLGGVPGVDPENCTEICATPSGIYAFTKEIFSKDMKELFLIEWKHISRIYHSSTTKGSDATKNALLTAGLVRNSGIAVLGGFLCNGQKTEQHITITCKDDTGYESEILFRSTYQSQEIALFLNAQRAVLYKPEKTQATQGTVENPPVVDSIEQLKKLAELKNTGIITEEEFGLKKAELLARI